MNHFGDKVSFIWGVADLIRDTFKRGKYQDVILPFTVLRRLDCVLQPTKEKVLHENAKLKEKKLDNPSRACARSQATRFITRRDTTLRNSAPAPRISPRTSATTSTAFRRTCGRRWRSSTSTTRSRSSMKPICCSRSWSDSRPSTCILTRYPTMRWDISSKNSSANSMKPSMKTPVSTSRHGKSSGSW